MIAPRARLLASAALGLLVTSCGGGSSPITATAPTTGTTPPVTPAPTPVPVPTAYNVDPCLSQSAQNGSESVLQLVIPDEIDIDLSRAVSFPNGRQLEDPVIDLTLSRLFLDLSKQSVNTFVNLPLNPDQTPRHFKAAFPYFGDARNITPTVPAATQTGFDFRTDADPSFVRVDRMGMPAVATVLIRAAMKTAYNDANPSDDANAQFTLEERADLEERAEALADDFARLNLAICAKPG